MEKYPIELIKAIEQCKKSKITDGKMKDKYYVYTNIYVYDINKCIEYMYLYNKYLRYN